MKQILDERGHACPLPVVNAKKAAAMLTNGGTLEVLVDNEAAVQNLKRMAESSGYSFSEDGEENGVFRVEIVVSSDTGKEVETQSDVTDSACIISGQKNTVVVINTQTMGVGNDELGKNLMKAFIFALTKQEKLPDTILFYNGGAFLTCEGSDSLEDLKNMENAGVTILTCGTCLNFYGITDRLQVGNVTNMYEIVERQNKADLIIRP